MSYLNPPYPNNFQELCAAMPIFYLDVFEMRAVLRAQGRLLDGLCEGTEKLVDANFILTADEATIKLWEKALKITYSGKLTLEQRRRVVIGYIIGLNHIGEPEIREIIGQYTDGNVTVDFAMGVITVAVYGEIFDQNTLLDTLIRRIPAHLSLALDNIVIAEESITSFRITPVLGPCMSITQLPELEAEPLPPARISVAGALCLTIAETILPELEDVV